MLSNDRRIALIHTSRVPPYRLLLRARFTLRLRRWARRPVADFAGTVRRPADRFDAAAASPIAGEVRRLRRLAFANSPEAIRLGRLTLRGQTREVGPLARFDWSRLAGAKVDDVNWFYELSYLGFLAAFDAAATAGRLATELMAAMEAAATPGAWAKNLAWKPIAVANRLMNLIAIAEALHAAGLKDPAFDAALLRHGAICEGLLTELREDHLQFNHEVFNITALLVWRAATGRAIPAALEADLIRSLRHQVLSDGGHAERSPTYHIHVLSLARLAAVAPGVSARGREALEAIAGSLTDSLAVVAHPDGDIALFNDAALNDAPPAHAFLGPDAGAAACLVAPEAGYGRLSSAAVAAILDGGLPGPRANPGHAHADYLSCEVSWLGRRLITDFGCASYVSGPARDRTRAGASHNGPRLAERELIEFAGAFRVGRYSEASIRKLSHLPNAIGAWCVPYFDRRLALARVLILNGDDGLIIADVWSGAAAPAPLRFLVASTWTAEFGADGAAHLRAQDGGRAIVVPLLGQRLAIGAEQYFPLGPGLPEPAACLTVSPQGAAGGHVSILAIGRPEKTGALRAAAAAIGDFSVGNLLSLARQG